MSIVPSDAPPSRRRLLPNALSGAGQALVSGLVLFALYRLLLERLGAAQVGAWSLLMAWLMLARLADLGLPGGMLRLAALGFAEGHGRAASRMLRRSMLVVALTTAVAASVIAWLVQTYAPTLLVEYEHPSHVLVFAAVAAWLTCVGVAVRSGLDAVGRVDVRHAITVLQNVLFLVASFWLVGPHGMRGLVWAQCCANLASLLLTWAAFRWEVRGVRGASRATDHAPQLGMRALFRYAVPFQISTVAALLVDPLVKLMLGQFASLAHIAWYEMASRLVLQVRGVVVNALEALVPHVAALGNGHRRESIDEDYRSVFEINLAMSSLGLGLVVANLPLIGRLWLGTHQPVFIASAALLAASWWVNGFAAPAYFVALGLGIQRWNVISHLVMTASVAVLGLVLGTGFGGTGVLAAFFLATCISTAVLLLGVHREIAAITLRPLALRVPRGYAVAAVIVGIALAVVGPDLSLPGLLGYGAITSLQLVSTLWFTGQNRSAVRAMLTALKRRAAQRAHAARATDLMRPLTTSPEGSLPSHSEAADSRSANGLS